MQHGPLDKLEELIWGDAIERHGIAGRLLATLLRYLYAVARDFFSGQLTLRAMSLVYTTLLSVVPLLAFSFSVLKGLGVHKALEKRLYGFLEPLGDKGVEITDQLMTLVYNVNGRVLGGIGLAFFIYTAISMVQKIEESVNYVWYVSKPRNFARRFTEYVFLMLIGPVIIVVAVGMLTSLQNERAVQWLLENRILGSLFVEIGKLAPYVLMSGVFTFLYMFMPNTTVKLSSALVGGVAGGLMWATLSAIFTAFVVNSTRNQAIYASFAITISTLIWLYLNWLILLIGSQLAFYFQNPAYMRHGRRDPRLSNAMRERLALNIMFLVGQVFRDPNKRIRLIELSEALQIPSLTLAPIATDLEEAGLLTLTEHEALQPGRDMSRIRLDEILAVVRADGDTSPHHVPRWAQEIADIGAQLDGAVSATVGAMTLSDLLDAPRQTPCSAPATLVTPASN
jgi:membrane protein